MKKTVLALTGLIGSGKSVVSTLLKIYDVAIYDSDSKAKYLMNNDEELRQSIVDLFGVEAYDAQGLNRKYIAAQAFSSPALLAKLNAAVHPAVCRDFVRWAEEQKNRVVAIETALLLESGLIDCVDKVVVVAADDELRLQRAMLRDSQPREAILQRMSHQTPQAELIKHADFVVNNGLSDSLLMQVEELVSTL